MMNRCRDDDAYHVRCCGGGGDGDFCRELNGKSRRALSSLARFSVAALLVFPVTSVMQSVRVLYEIGISV